MSYVLHYAPDNASLVIRLALETAGIGFETRLVDRATNAQHGAEYRRLNPQAQIPALETPQGVMSETAAILIWLSEKHPGLGLGPAPGDPMRGQFLRWILVVANTLHPALRQSFYPTKFIAAETADSLRTGLRGEITRVLSVLEREAALAQVIGSPTPNALDFYLGCCLRWAQLYPVERPIAPVFSTMPHLFALLHRLDTHPATAVAQEAEGLGPTPFSAPSHPNPPEGSAL